MLLQFKEYLEIKSANTIERLIISGEGVLPDYEFSPKFVVSRIESTWEKYADCVFQVMYFILVDINLLQYFQLPY